MEKARAGNPGRRDNKGRALEQAAGSSKPRKAAERTAQLELVSQALVQEKCRGRGLVPLHPVNRASPQAWRAACLPGLPPCHRF